MPKLVDHKLRQSELGRIAAIAIAEHGYDRLTLAALAKRAGCSVGAVSYYAKTKDDVLLMACTFLRADLCARLAKVKEKYSNLEALKQALYECLPCSSTHSRMFENVAISALSKMKDHDEIRNFSHEFSQDILDIIAGLVTEAQHAGEISSRLDPVEIAYQMEVYIRALTIHIYTADYRPSAREQLGYADKWLDRMLAAPATN